nr:MAG TPA: hypothetical protein [Caudoviricetes sp.]
MIQPENYIFDIISKALKAAHNGIFVSGEYVNIPASFPAVTVIESDNSVYERMRTTTIENAVSLMYECNIYTNRAGYKKQDANAILQTLSDTFEQIGFTRTFCNPVANLQDATIYRIVVRFQGVCDKDFMIYQN